MERRMAGTRSPPASGSRSGGRDLARLIVEDRVGLQPTERASLEARIAEFETLEDLIRWGRDQVPPVTIESVVTQDEFTHDVLVLDHDLVLVYDTS